jgi:hypothetical protein
MFTLNTKSSVGIYERVINYSNCMRISNIYIYLCFEDREVNLEGTFDTVGKGGGSLKCEMDAVSVKFPGRFCL